RSRAAGRTGRSRWRRRAGHTRCAASPSLPATGSWGTRSSGSRRSGCGSVARQEPEARRLRRELFDDETLDKLMAATDERGLSLTGEGGFLPEMIKAVLERGMQAELTDHLGYEKGDPAGQGSGNSRNGTTPKTVASEVGDIDLDQPRDRNSSFASALVPKGARRLGGLEDMIISLY